MEKHNTSKVYWKTKIIIVDFQFCHERVTIFFSGKGKERVWGKIQYAMPIFKFKKKSSPMDMFIDFRNRGREKERENGNDVGEKHWVVAY